MLERDLRPSMRFALHLIGPLLRSRFCRSSHDGERGSTVYAAYIADQVAAQEARKVSIEQRGLAVITTSGILVSLLFGLTTTLAGAADYQLPSGAEPWVFAALVAFVLAAIAGILINLPLRYSGVKSTALRGLLKENWDDSPIVAEKRIAATQVKIIATAKKRNKRKGQILFFAAGAEILAVLFLAFAIRGILLA
jgi:uncharacterized integral membrane protein